MTLHGEEWIGASYPDLCCVMHVTPVSSRVELTGNNTSSFFFVTSATHVCLVLASILGQSPTTRTIEMPTSATSVFVRASSVAEVCRDAITFMFC